MIDASNTPSLPPSTMTTIAASTTKMSQPRRKSVSFAYLAEVVEVENIEEYSQEEVHNMWWTREDYHVMKTTAASIVKSVRSTNIPVASHGLDARMVFRGLESQIDRERVGKWITAALDAVLLIPFYEHDEQFGEADTVQASKTSIAELNETYSLYGQLALKEAHVHALLDELAVLAELESQKEQDLKKIDTTTKAVTINLVDHHKNTVDCDISDSSSSSSSSESSSTKATKRSRGRYSGDKSSSIPSSSSSSTDKKKRSSHKKRNKMVRRQARIFDTQ
mmetsp:Transcript_57394/g.140083  ORF Transcript_57394/g.140083 Transcript_57394/m.140083 type:complete len:279 (+) Transcript_57394:67-903(+)